MNLIKQTALLALTGLILSGCASNSDKPKDNFLSRTQQEMSLSRARAPQQFGFSLHAVEHGITFSGAGRTHPNHFTAAEMIEENIPVIRINGRSRRLSMNILVDVSSPVSWMEFSTSQDFNAYFMGINDMVIPYRGNYNTGGANAYAAVVTQLRINHLFIENVPFYIRMSRGSLGPLARGIRKPKVDAVLGYDNLQIFEYVQFDLQNNAIHFSATNPYTPNEAALSGTAEIVRAPGHGLAVEGIIDDLPTPVIIDFAADFSIARGDAKVATTRLLEVGDLSFTNTRTLLLPTHVAPPRIGRKLLEPYLVTICNKEGVVYFERLPSKE